MPAPHAARGRPVTIALGGDLMLGRMVNRAVAEHGAAYPWGDLLPLLWTADLFLVNLECALTDCWKPWGGGRAKAFYFRAEPERVEALRLGRVDAAVLANNHVGDFGLTGLVDTVRRLGHAGIAVAGAGGNREQARAPALLRARDRRVHLVAFADHPAEWAARPFLPGINHTPISVRPDDFRSVERTIRAARHDADLVICSLHWGPNMRERPSREFRAFAHRVIEAGADVVWGHSAHVLQGIEIHDGGLILYDTGDLVDDYAVDQRLRNDLGALFLLRLWDADGFALEVVPLRIAQCQVNLATGEDRDRVLWRLEERSAELGTRPRLAQGRLFLRVPRGVGPVVSSV